MDRIATLVLMLSAFCASPAVAGCVFELEGVARTACDFAGSPIAGIRSADHDQIIELLGDPTSIERSERPNAYFEGESDLYVSYVYERTLYSVIVPRGDWSKSLPSHLESSDPELKLRFGLRIGMSAADVVSILGEPIQKSGFSWRYANEADDLIVRVRDSTFFRLVWQPYQG